MSGWVIQTMCALAVGCFLHANDPSVGTWRTKADCQHVIREIGLHDQGYARTWKMRCERSEGAK